MTFGVSTYSIHRAIGHGRMTPDEALRWCAKIGAPHVEITPHGMGNLTDTTYAKNLAAALDGTGTRITNLSIGSNFLSENLDVQIAQAKLYIDTAAALSLKTIRIDSVDWMPTNKATTENFQQDLPKIVHGYNALCEYADTLGVTVLIENHGFYANGQERIRQILTSVDAKNFGLQLDIGNFACVDNDCYAAVHNLIEFARTIHMKDFFLRTSPPGCAPGYFSSGAWFTSPAGMHIRGSILGQGDIPVERIAQHIRSSGFDGPVYLDFEGLEDSLYGTHTGFLNMRRMLGE